MPNAKNIQAVGEIRERLERVQGAVLADYRGLNVGQVEQLRKRLRQAGVEYKVLKNTLIRLAAEDAQVKGLEPALQGPTAVAFGYSDPVVAAKVLTEFAKENKALEVKGGILDKRYISADQVKALADLPSREVLLGQVARVFQAPITGLAIALQGNLRNLVNVVDAVRKQKEGA